MACRPQVSPIGQQQFTDSAGFFTQRYDYDSLEENEALSFAVEYVKEDVVPSLEDFDEDSSANSGVIIAVVIAGCVAIAGILYWALRKPSPTVKGEKRRTSGGGIRGRDVGITAETPTRARFCTQCGSRLQRSARFCSACGAKAAE